MKSVVARSARSAGRTAERLWLTIVDVIAVARQGQAAYGLYRELSRLPDAKLRGVAPADLAGYCLGIAPLPREAASDGAREVPKQLVDKGSRQAALVAVVGLGFLGAESVLLSLHGHGSMAAALLAVLLASTLSNIAGFAFSALCAAMLFHLMDSPVYAVQVMLACSIAGQLLGVAALWRAIDWRSLPAFLGGGILGVPAGVYLLLHLPIGVYRETIGALLIAYGGYRFLSWRVRTFPLGTLADACAGFLGGVTGGLVAFPGASVAIACSLKDWDKARQRAVYQPFILIMQPLALLSIHLMRPTSPAATPLDLGALAFVPAALLGAWFGLRIFKRLSDRQFSVAVSILLILSGGALIL